MKKTTFREGVTKLPAGRYCVIDPCYVFQHDDEECVSKYPSDLWDEFCEFTFKDKKSGREAFSGETDGEKWVTWGTAYGDGEYPVVDGCESVGNAGVDSGCLALIPESLVEEQDKRLGVLVTLESDATPEFEDGDMRVEGIHVCTCGCVEHDDDVCEDE